MSALAPQIEAKYNFPRLTVYVVKGDDSILGKELMIDGALSRVMLTLAIGAHTGEGRIGIVVEPCA